MRNESLSDSELACEPNTGLAPPFRRMLSTPAVFVSRCVMKATFIPLSVIRSRMAFASVSISGMAFSMMSAWMPFLPKMRARSS